MNIEAVSISGNLVHLFEGELSGHVHSVFTNAINIVFGSQLIGITRFTKGNSPYNILVDVDKECSFSRLWVKGTNVDVLEKQMYFSNQIIITLKDVALWQPDLAKSNGNIIISKHILSQFFNLLSALPKKNLFMSLVSELEQEDVSTTLSPQNLDKVMVAGNCSSSSSEEVVLKYLQTAIILDNGHPHSFMMELLRIHMNRFVTSCQNFEEDLALESLESIIGCGEGLTPQGDDIICGFLVTLLHAREVTIISSQLSTIIDKIKAKLEIINRNTTWTSQMMIDAAIKGWINEYAAKFIEEIFDTGSVNANIILDIADIGHSSGLALLAGIYEALKIIYHDQLKLIEKGF